MAYSSSHGEVKAYWKGNQLIVEPTNTFNIDGIIAATDVVKKLVDARPVQSWIRVVHFRTETTAGPVEGAKYIVESFQYSRDNGCKFVCVVGGNALNKEGFVRVCKAVGLPLYFFEQLEAVGRFITTLDTLSGVNS